MKRKMNRMHMLRPAIGSFLLMVAMSLGQSALSFFNQPVSDALGVGRGSFTIYYSLLTAAGALASPFMGQFANQHGTRPIMILSGIWCAAGFMAFSVIDQLWMFYTVAIIMGLLCTSCVLLCANVTIQSSYSSEQATGLIGFVMSGAGVGGIITSITLPRVISSYGWQIGYRVLGISWLILVWTAVWFIGRPNISDVQMKVTSRQGMSRREAIHGKQLYLIIACGFLLNACCAVTVQVPAILSSYHFSITQVGLLTSLMAASIGIGQVFQGWLYRKVGIKKGGSIAISLFLLGFIMLTSKPTAVPALVLIAIGIGIITTLIPLSTKYAFGQKEYASIYGLINMGVTSGNFLAAPLWGLIYDKFGTYHPGLLTAPTIVFTALVLHILVFNKKENIN